jgi:site-specific recombinase XerC
MVQRGDSTLNLNAALSLYLEALRRRGRTASTLDNYGRYLHVYAQFLDEQGLAEPTLEHLRLDLAEAAQDWLRDRSMGRRDGAAAEKAFVVRIKGLSHFLWRRGLLETDPLARLETPRLTKLHRMPFSEGDVRGLVVAAQLGPNPLMERAFLLLALDTGARIGELCGATIHDLDLDAGTILLRITKFRRPRRVIFGVRSHPSGGPCVMALRLWLAVRQAGPGTDALFLSRTGQSLSTRAGRRIYASLGLTAGVADCIPHRSRHTHASELLAALPGAELQLRNRLGHIDKATLADYVTISDPAAQAVADVASLSAKWDL